MRLKLQAFKSIRVGATSKAIIIIKLFIMFRQSKTVVHGINNSSALTSRETTFYLSNTKEARTGILLNER
jgi:hypothetical protein